MKAWVIHDFGDMRLEDVPFPEIKEDWILIKVEVCQPSVTEVMRFKGVDVPGVDIIRKALKEKGPSRLLGHEFSGIVQEIGPDVKNIKIGNRVSLNNPKNPKDNQWVGIDYPGCFAEYIAVPEEIMRVVPEELTANEAACLQPLSSVVPNIERANIKMGDIVVVTGLGVMGLGTAQIARVSGAGKIIGIDIREENLKLAKNLGIEIVINTSKDNVLEIIRNETNGKGADIVFECAGGSVEQGLSGHTTLWQAFDIARKGGKIIQLAHPMSSKDIPLPFDLPKILRAKAIEYSGPISPLDRHFDHVADLIASKRINVSQTITHTLNGIEKLPEAFDITGNKSKYKAINPAQLIM